MGSKTIDLEIAVLHKTIKTPQQYFHTESLLAAMVKPLPAPRTPGGGETGRGPGAPIQRAEKAETAGSSGARRAAPAVAEAGALPRGPQGAGRERRRGARRRGGLGAPGRRAGRSSAGRLPCGSRVPGAGCGEGARPGHKDGNDARATGCAPRAGPLRTINPGGRAAARARGRRVGAVPCPGARSDEGRLWARGSLPRPCVSWPAEQAGGLGPRRGRLTRAGLCVRGGRRDRLCARLLTPTGAAVPAEESQRRRRAVRAL